MAHLRPLLFVAFLLLLSFVVFLPATAQGVCPNDSAEVWTETETEWLGIWTEQDDAGSFTAVFSRPGEEYEASLTIDVDDDGEITIDRINPRTPGYYLQGDCVYEGQLSEGGSYASGTVVCEIEDGGEETEPFFWQATISCGDAEPIGTFVNATGLEGGEGATFSFVCAPVTEENPFRAVWGTDYYTDDSSICTAAIHAGVITNSGGAVTIQFYRGLGAYFDSERNGVTTNSYGTWGRSFTFYGLQFTDPVTDGIGWGTNAVAHRNDTGATFTYTCPDDGTVGAVWGTDVYTDDSSICTAAVHAGLISFENGGSVTIQMLEGKPEYEGTERNGVTTYSYGNWHGSYQFVSGK